MKTMGPKSCDRPSTCILTLRRSVPGNNGNTEEFARSRVSEFPGCGSGRSVYKNEKQVEISDETQAPKGHTPEGDSDAVRCPLTPGRCRASPPRHRRDQSMKDSGYA